MKTHTSLLLVALLSLPPLAKAEYFEAPLAKINSTEHYCVASETYSDKPALYIIAYAASSGKLDIDSMTATVNGEAAKISDPFVKKSFFGGARAANINLSQAQFDRACKDGVELVVTSKKGTRKYQIPAATFASVKPETRIAERVEKNASACVVEKDNYQKTTIIKAPAIGLPRGEMFLRCVIGKSGVPIYQLFVHVHRTSNQGWAFFEKAYDSGGTEHEVTVIRRDAFNGGSVDESVGVNFSHAELAAIGNGGIDLKLIGKNDEQVLRVPSSSIKGFLQRVDTELTPAVARTTVQSKLSE